MPSTDASQTAAKAIETASTILAITGAGISAESGIPTFRDEGGWWRSLDPEELATTKAFREDPLTVWRWYEHRRRLVASARPNHAHRALSALERDHRRVMVLTQNVDDLHERAGSREVVHIHGTLWRARCVGEGRVRDLEDEISELPPRCECGSVLRPDVVWFDEALPPAEISVIEQFLATTSIDVTLVVGTAGVFDYIRDWMLAARARGSLIVEINLRETKVTKLADVVVRAPAASFFRSRLPRYAEST